MAGSTPTMLGRTPVARVVSGNLRDAVNGVEMPNWWRPSISKKPLWVAQELPAARNALIESALPSNQQMIHLKAHCTFS